MTRRITLLIGVTCVVLALTALLGGCGADEASAPPRTTRPPERRELTSDPEPEPGAGRSGDEALCAAAAEAAADAQEALGGPPESPSDIDLEAMAEVGIDFYEAIEPFTDGQLREDIRLMVSVARASLAGEPASAEATADIAEASARFVRELTSRCEGPVLPRAA